MANGGMEIDFRRSLVARDEFVVESVLARTGKRRFLFHQDIYLVKVGADGKRKRVLEAKVHLTPINLVTLRPEMPEELEKLLVDFPIIEMAA